MSARRMITVIVPGYIVDYCYSTFHFISIIFRLTYSQYVCAMYDLVTVGLPGYTYTVHYYRSTRFFISIIWNWYSLVCADYMNCGIIEVQGTFGISCLISYIFIRVITKLPNTEQSSKGKGKTHKWTNRQNQSTTGKLGKRNGPDLVQALKCWITYLNSFLTQNRTYIYAYFILSHVMTFYRSCNKINTIC